MKKINRDPTMTKKWGSRAKLESGLSLSFFFYSARCKKKKSFNCIYLYFCNKISFLFQKDFF